MPDLRRQPGPHVFVTDLERLELDDADRHHLERVLRLRAGDPLTVADGTGAWRAAEFGPSLRASGPVNDAIAPGPLLTVGVALTKAAKPDLVVQKATEIGIDRIVVFPGAHSVAVWDQAKQVTGIARLSKIAREAAMQSRRIRIPTVEFVSALSSFAATPGAVRADFGGGPLTADHTTVLIGPEGGWSRDEVSLVPAAVDLGSTVLRAETAALVAATLMVRTRYATAE